MNEPTLHMVGNLGQDPRTNVIGNDRFVMNLRVAVTPRVRKGEQWDDGETQWWDVSMFGPFAEGLAAVLRKGDKVTINGTFRGFNTYEKDGKTLITPQCTADNIGVVPRGEGTGGASRRERPGTGDAEWETATPAAAAKKAAPAASDWD